MVIGRHTRLGSSPGTTATGHLAKTSLYLHLQSVTIVTGDNSVNHHGAGEKAGDRETTETVNISGAILMCGALSQMHHPGDKHYHLLPFYRWGSQGLGRRRSCPRSSREPAGRVGIQTRAGSAPGAQRRQESLKRRDLERRWGCGKERGGDFRCHGTSACNHGPLGKQRGTFLPMRSSSSIPSGEPQQNRHIRFHSMNEKGGTLDPKPRRQRVACHDLVNNGLLLILQDTT